METLLCARSTIVLAALVAALMGSGTLSAETTPLAVSPGSASGTEIAAACPTFSWSAVSGANGYQIVAYQVAKGTSPSTNPQELKQLWTVTLPGSVHIWTPPVGQCFAHGGRYAWAVRALVGTTPTNWSNANLFSVERAPSAEEVRAAIATLRRYLDAKETITKASVSSASASPRPDATSARTLARPRHNTKEKGKPIRTRQNPLGLKSA
ncbi:MAG TPA: hypothetical protein VKA53_01535, partial [Thermoanaerobaculia bacterium]|nr:hypothetical protein [Thermoanaerobaculia bacterium]